jgi:hypothetical protein
MGTDIDDGIRDPDLPVSEANPVSPSVDDGPTEGVSTLAGMFPTTVVDQVQETPMATPPPGGEIPPIWVIRPNTKIEDMTDGVPIVHMAFDPGIRYKVPFAVAAILNDRDLLMEAPYPYDQRR